MGLVTSLGTVLRFQLNTRSLKLKIVEIREGIFMGLSFMKPKVLDYCVSFRATLRRCLPTTHTPIFIPTLVTSTTTPLQLIRHHHNQSNTTTPAQFIQTLQPHYQPTILPSLHCSSNHHPHHCRSTTTAREPPWLLCTKSQNSSWWDSKKAPVIIYSTFFASLLRINFYYVNFLLFFFA